MCLRVGQIDVLAAARDQADKPFARLHVGGADGFLAQAFGSEKLERSVGQPHIDRAHLRDHIRRDQADDTVQARFDVLQLGLPDARPVP